jgi:hypothetical protein
MRNASVLALATSLLLGTVSVGSWIWSQRHYGKIRWENSKATKFACVELSGGCVALELGSNHFEERGVGVEASTVAGAAELNYYPYVGGTDKEEFRWGPFGYYSDLDGDLWRRELVFSPLAILVLPMSGLGVWAVRLRRRRPRGRAGACGACGYDLFGNVSGICPECGQAHGVR